MSEPAGMPWAIVALDGQAYALPVRHVQELLIAPSVDRVPQTPEWVRGVINLRGQVMPLIDLRKRLGMRASPEEIDHLCTVLEQREEDHRHWLAELEGSIAGGRAFSLATDPHECAFGRWYDAYRAPNLLVDGLLKKFEVPHKTIHGLAASVGDLVAQGQAERAMEAIDGARQGVLKRMTQLFGDLRQLLRETSREIAVVLHISLRKFAVCVDSVESVERLAPDSIESLLARVPGIQAGALARSAGRRSKNGGLVLILEAERLADTLESLQKSVPLYPEKQPLDPAA